MEGAYCKSMDCKIIMERLDFIRRRSSHAQLGIEEGNSREVMAILDSMLADIAKIARECEGKEGMRSLAARFEDIVRYLEEQT